MKNPAYKGKWVHPEIDNPDYAPDAEIYAFDNFGRVGLDLWQVSENNVTVSNLNSCLIIYKQS